MSTTSKTRPVRTAVRNFFNRIFKQRPEPNTGKTFTIGGGLGSTRSKTKNRRTKNRKTKHRK